MATEIPVGSINYPINVLANDIAGSAGSISIIAADSTTPNGGSVRIDGDRLLYTPRADFVGSEQFTYTIQDTRGVQSRATVTVHVGDASADDIVGLDLVVTDLNGTPIDQITAGSQFQLRGFVQDLRTGGANRGIFAAYEDVLYSSNLVSPVLSTTNDPDLGFQVQFGPDYNRVREGDVLNAGIINEIGAVSTSDAPLGSDRLLVFTVTMTANAVGTATFVGDPADIRPQHDTLTFEPVQPVPFDEITYGFDSLTIVSGTGGGAGGEGFHNHRMALDVNNDGFISPIDALGIINQLNGGGAGSLGDDTGEGEDDAPHMFVDTNDDGFISPLDALLVINHLNESIGAGSAEGELGGLLVPGVTLDSADSQEAAPTVSPQDLGGETIGIRRTTRAYGPAIGQSDATDSLFGSDESMDDIVNQLAPSIEENWKRRI